MHNILSGRDTLRFIKNVHCLIKAVHWRAYILNKIYRRYYNMAMMRLLVILVALLLLLLLHSVWRGANQA
jgi:hypothetical protein